jgi:hypothetical protein
MRAVPRTPELARILGLPRRSGASCEDLIDPLSEFLKKPGHVCRPVTGPDDPGCAGGFTRLNLLQTQALSEFHDRAIKGKGLFLQGPLGCGKTGVALFAPTLLEAILNPMRALYIVPGSAIRSGKVFSEINILREHWNIIPFQLVSYQKLARKEQEFFFFEPPGPYNLLLLDELQFCRNESTAVASRIHRLREKAGQEIEIVRPVTGQAFRVRVPPKPVMGGMTATPVKDSLKDTAHTMEWTLDDESPVPRDSSDIDDWAAALDAEPFERLAPGALTVFSDGKDDLESVRRGVGKWIFDTPGCISSSETYVDAKLSIALRDVPLSKTEDDWFKVLRGDPDDPEEFPGMTTPDGDVFTEKAELWRHACSMALGYYTIWDPPAPQEWRTKRYRWHSWAREILAASDTFDTIGHLASAIDSGRIDNLKRKFGDKTFSLRDVLNDWREIEPIFVLCSCGAQPGCQRPHSVPVWVGDTALKYASKWLEGGGIVWTGHRHFRLKLAELTGCPCFGQGGLTPDGTQSIVNTKAQGIIASTVACGAMFNLQQYNRNLIASIWPAAYAVEQTIGRTHRQGQRRDVTVEWMISCREQLDGFAKAASCQAPLLRDMWRVPSRLCGARVQSDKITTNGWAFAEQS